MSTEARDCWLKGKTFDTKEDKSLLECGKLYGGSRARTTLAWVENEMERIKE